MSDMHSDRLALLKSPEVRAWCENLIAQWSNNDLTTMGIVELAILYEQLVDLQKLMVGVPLIVETNAGPKGNPVIKQHRDAQKRFFAIAKQLQIDPTDIIEGEAKDDQGVDQ